MLSVLELLLGEQCTACSSRKFLLGHITTDFREGDCVRIICLRNLVCFEKRQIYLSIYVCVCVLLPFAGVDVLSPI